ncbi:MAG: four helix bundle protein [Flavobacterium sp.]|nr:four helix bundle protein [Flavobacterium sp.]
MRNDKDNIIVQLTFDLALDVISFTEELRAKHKYEMASQIFRCGTSIGANSREAQNAESRADFIHKFKIAAKEADELEYWLDLSEKSEYYPKPPVQISDRLKSVQLVLNKIISSSKKP